MVESPPLGARPDEAITGWRAWNLGQDGDGPRLLPAGSGANVWQPRRAVEARCNSPALLRLGTGRHTAPDVRCHCGIYAGHSMETLERTRPAWPPPCVVGTVSLWGTVIEHERGWRARFAYPSRLRLVCSVCAWCEPGSGVPEVVHTFAGCLYTLCAAHRGGIEVPDGRRTRPTGADPQAMQAALIQAYAVDLLPQEAVAPLFDRPAMPGLPYTPSIRVVPPRQEGRDAGVTTAAAWRWIVGALTGRR